MHHPGPDEYLFLFRVEQVFLSKGERCHKSYPVIGDASFPVHVNYSFPYNKRSVPES